MCEENVAHRTGKHYVSSVDDESRRNPHTVPMEIQVTCSPVKDSLTSGSAIKIKTDVAICRIAQW